jgi:hypothetical protein
MDIIKEAEKISPVTLDRKLMLRLAKLTILFLGLFPMELSKVEMLIPQEKGSELTENLFRYSCPCWFGHTLESLLLSCSLALLLSCSTSAHVSFCNPNFVKQLQQNQQLLCNHNKIRLLESRNYRF